MADRYTDPYLQDVASNIGKAFSIDNMGRSVVQRAQAAHLQLQSDKLTRERDARVRGGNLLRAGADPKELAANGYEGDIPIAQTAGTTLYMRANDPSATTEQRAGAFLGAGHALGKDTAFSAADRELVAARDARDAKARSDSSASIGAGATITAANIAEGGRMARRYDAPVHVTPGSGVIFSPGDTRTPTDMTPGSTYVPVPAKPGADKTVVVEGPEGKPVYALASDAVAKGLPATTARQPATPDTKESEANAIAYSALQSIGATTVNGSTVEIHPDFLAQFGDKLPAAKDAAVQARQKSKNPGAAETAFLTALGIAPGRMFKPGSKFLGMGTSSEMVARPGAPAASAAPADPLEGRTATDASGNKIVRQGGKWVPVR